MDSVTDNIAIRPAGEADGPAVAAVRRASWRAAYTGIIDAAIIERVTAPRPAGTRPPHPYLTTLVAVAEYQQQVVGYASYGPERSVVTQPAPPGSPELTEAGQAGEASELYAIYLAPDRWSSGVGRALMDAALDALRVAGYRYVVLWVLTANARARRFYAKAGFAPDGGTNVLAGLGGVEELRYARDL
jgi:GNAT superfamily N-acetyltransferase